MNFTAAALIFILGFQLCKACDMDQTRQGCRIKNRQCLCGHGCISEYRYPTMSDCQIALRGKRSDVCDPSPCLHGGTCIQVSQHPGYKCRCEGTGYFGLRCNREFVCKNQDVTDGHCHSDKTDFHVVFKVLDGCEIVKTCPIPGVNSVSFPYECIVI